MSHKAECLLFLSICGSQFLGAIPIMKSHPVLAATMMLLGLAASACFVAAVVSWADDWVCPQCGVKMKESAPQGWPAGQSEGREK